MTAGHKVGADDIGQPLDRRPGALRLLDQTDDLRQRRVAPDARRLEAERAGLVHGGADDLVARALLDRHRLAGEHRLVDRRAAVEDPPVDRDPLARSHEHDIAEAHGRDRHVALDAAFDDPGRLGLEADEPADRLARPALGPGLEVLPEEDQADDHRRGVEVQIRHVVADRRGQDAGAEAVVEDGGHAVGVCGRRPERDERVHVGGAVARRAERALVEPPAGPELDRRRQRQLQPRVGQPGGQPRGAEHLARHAEHDQHADAERGDHPPQNLQPLPPLPCFLGRGGGRDVVRCRDDGGVGGGGRGCDVSGAGVACRGGAFGPSIDDARSIATPRTRRRRRHRARRRGAFRQSRTVADALDGLHEGIGRHVRGRVGHARRLGRQVDHRAVHARHAGQRLLDGAHAGSARHALDRQRDVAGRRVAQLFVGLWFIACGGLYAHGNLDMRRWGVSLAGAVWPGRRRAPRTARARGHPGPRRGWRSPGSC